MLEASSNIKEMDKNQKEAGSSITKYMPPNRSPQ